MDPLRPLNNLFWGYIQDEQHRLTVARRNYEYDHHYGLRLEGKAVQNFRPVDTRSKFLEAFHHLLRLCTVFYKQDDDTTVMADAFPVLNALKEVHLILSQGAHNQFGDLPSTSRIEMLMQQWFLARPEFREFLPTRLMVAYPEPWMDRVDAMKKLQSWDDTSVLHFRNLGMFGEQILLSIRWGHWSDEFEPVQALNWARFFRPQTQGYIHAYRAVTGVDLSADPTVNIRVDSTLPSVLLKRRLAITAEGGLRWLTMLDFTSALYLGMHHPSRSLRPWRQLTLGVPAALAEPPGAGEVAQGLAELQGCEQGVLMPSTLHLFWDLFGMLSRQPVTLYLDEGAYAIARWGAERAAATGLAVHRFRHHDPQALLCRITATMGRRTRPVIIVDGFCPACGRPAPVGAYLEILRRFGGLLVLDDTQSLGLLGETPDRHTPYGKGGGGVLRWSGQTGPDILLGSSLAKGFGVPVAVLAGSKDLVRRFATASDTRVHCSPPSSAVIGAAAHALAVNGFQGDRLRRRLTRRIGQFRKGLAQIGLSSTGDWFPVQTLRGISGTGAVRLQHRLSQRGVQAILSRPGNEGQARLSFLITARHSAEEIDRCIDKLDQSTNALKQRRMYRSRQPATILQPIEYQVGTTSIHEVNNESRIWL